MKYNPKKHHRRSIRLKGYDYAQAGLYFITICCQHRTPFFGDIKNGEMILNDAGEMIEIQWLDLKNRFPNIKLHEYVVMPNHFHGILEIVGTPPVVAQNGNETVAQNGKGQSEKGQPQGVAPTDSSTDSPTDSSADSSTDSSTETASGKTVGDMMDAFKSITTVEYIRGVKQNNWKRFDGKLWQRNYWEHIIRDDKAYQNISAYIINNPAKWNNDKLM